MSAVSSDSGNNEDCDLNIVPIIDCFTVLIAYLLISASFLSLAVFDVGVAVSGEGVTPVTDKIPEFPPFSLKIQLSPENSYDLKLSGGPDRLDLKIPIAALHSKFNLVGLKDVLSDFKTKYKGLEEITLSAAPQVKYSEVVKAIQEIKPLYTKVFITGEYEIQVH